MPFPPPGNLPDPRIEPKPPVSTALAEGFFTTVPPGKPALCSAGHYFNVMEYWLGPSHEAAATAKSLQSCPTLCNPIDNSPPGSCPWNSPGKNTGVGCHFLLQCMKVKSESEVAQLCPTLSNPMDCSLPGSSIHGISLARVPEWGAVAFSSHEATVTSGRVVTIRRLL